MPDGLQKYRETPRFTATTVPSALLSDHATKAGVWARLCVSDGVVLFFAGQGTGAQAQRLGAGQQLLVAPEQRHRVSLSADAVFHIEFLKQEAAPDDDPHL